MPLDANDPQVQLAIFGEQVDQFLKGEIGQYVESCAQEELESAAQEFATTSLYDTTKLADLQLKIRTANTVIGWLKQAIIAGKQAFDTEDL